MINLSLDVTNGARGKFFTDYFDSTHICIRQVRDDKTIRTIALYEATDENVKLAESHCKELNQRSHGGRMAI